MFRASPQAEFAPEGGDDAKQNVKETAQETKEQGKGFFGKLRDSVAGSADQASEKTSEKTSSSSSSAKSTKVSTSTSNTKVNAFDDRTSSRLLMSAAHTRDSLLSLVCAHVDRSSQRPSYLTQCGPGNDDAWNTAEQETELAKQEACNVKVQTQKTTETAEIAAQKKREVNFA